MSYEHFTELEQYIESLIERCHDLQNENAKLRQYITELDQARDELQNRNQQAANQVKRIIAQLKEQPQ